jgi:hypothetical protein
MAAEKDLLGEIRVASPCTASWDEMEGSEQVRFCRHCRKNVYDLSGMSRREATALVRETEPSPGAEPPGRQGLNPLPIGKNPHEWGWGSPLQRGSYQ